MVQLFLKILLPVYRLRECLPCSFPDGLRAIVPDVLGSIELLCFLYVCTYVTKSNLHCLSYVILWPIIIALGLIVVCTQSLCGKLFSQNTQFYTILTISHGTYLPNGSMVAILLTLSFMVLIYLSISGTCSLAEHMLGVIPFCLLICCICLNCLSANIAFILNPHAWYAWVSCSIDVISVLFLYLWLVLQYQSVYCVKSSLQMVFCWWTFYINCQCYFTVLLHYFLWYVLYIDFYMFLSSICCFFLSWIRC